ncbi:MAG: Crp/Fnr family transcriptional regulator [Caldimicrobium sp.]|nr:Crp/Fnr family transcriptional regulator [Caldimicrobium sp.]MCX7874300.1 Crp/Fnr family transcriptional regulator [Caldimicrobium sp.]
MFHEEQLIERNLKEIKDTLKHSLFFQTLPEDFLNRLAQIAILKKYDKNEQIFSEGERAYGFFIVVDGLVKIYKISSKGKEQILHIFGKGEVFAEIVLSSMDTYPAFASALVPTKLAFFEKRSFLKLIQQNPNLALYMIGIFAHRLKSLVKTIENLSLKDAPERLLSYLWDLSNQGNRSSFKLNVSKYHLALLLGISPETLSRLFLKFKEEGLLEINKKEIRIKEIERWKSIIQGNPRA